MKRGLFSITLFLFSFTLLAQEPKALFEQGNQAFEAENYTEAIKKYKAVLNQEFNSFELQYNLSTSYFRNGELAPARLHIERALVLQPGNSDAKHNLKVLRSKQKDNIQALNEFFAFKWWKSIRQSGGSTAWAIVCLIFVFLGVAGLFVWRFGNDRKQRKLGFLMAFSLILLSLFPFLFAFQQSSLEKDSRSAILFEQSINLKSAPEDNSTDLVTLHEGLKLTLLDQIGDWYQVQLVNGDQGWLPASSFRKI